MKAIPIEVSNHVRRYIKGDVTDTKLLNLAKISGYPVRLLRKAAIKAGRLPEDPVSKIFNTSTIEGLEAAEDFKSDLNDRYDEVKVVTISLSLIRIEGRNPPKPKE